MNRTQKITIAHQSALFFALLLTGAGLAADPVPDDYAAPYQVAVAEGQRVYRIDPENSRADIVTGKSGWLSRLGHEHVIVARPAEGYLLLTEDLVGSRADLRIEVESLVVDSAVARARQAMDSGLSEKDIQRTRTNMLEYVLEAARWPEIHLHISHLEGTMPQPVVAVKIDLHGVTREVALPVNVHVNDMKLTFTGTFELLQSDFNMRPFKAIAGGLRVSDSVQIRFEIMANLLKVQE